MDPITSGVISGLIVNALCGLEKPMARSVRRGAPHIEQQLKAELEKASSKYRIRLISRLPSINLTTAEEARFVEFLNSPFSRYAARAIAIEITAGSAGGDDATDMQDHITAIIALSANMPSSSASSLADLYYRSVSSTCSTTLEALKDKSPDAYAQVRDSAKREREAGYIKSLAHRTRIFRRLQVQDIIDAHQFVREYVSLVHSRTAEVAPAHLSEQHSVPLRNLYVKPRLVRSSAADQDMQSSFESFVGSIYRDVVLGDPGAGKSTMAQKIVHDLSSSESPDLIPFIISLRDLQAYQISARGSITDYIESHLREDYNLDPPVGVIDFLLVSGRALVIFDGLDELIDTYKKRQMRRTLENFAELYAPSSILITSRTVGYAEAPMSGRIFRASRLASFTGEQAEIYVRNWFRLDTSLTVQQRNSLVSGFMTESSSIEDLRTNPLMLSLLCNVYRGIGSIPRSRAELYQQCALLLFDRWDAQRGIMAPGAMRGAARLSLQAIALWIYESPNTARAVRHTALSKRLQAFLLESRYEDEVKAHDVAEDLLQLWRGRAWVMTDRGTAPNGEPLYGFSHQTFLEYFAGVELTRRNPDPTALWTVLGTHVAREEWDVVAQIAIQTLDAFYDQGTDQIVSLLIRDAERSATRERLTLLSFVSRYISALEPGPALCRALTRSCIELALIGQPVFPRMPKSDKYIDEALSSIDRAGRRGGGEVPVDIGPEELLNPLMEALTALGDPGSYSRDEFGRYLHTLVQQGNGEIATKAFVLAMSEEDLIRAKAGGRGEASPGNHSLREGASIFSLDEVGDVVRRWGDLNFWIPIECTRRGYLRLTSAVRSYGVDLLFCAQPSVVNTGDWHVGAVEPIAASLIEELVEAQEVAALRVATPQLLREVGARFRAMVKDKSFEGIDSDWLGESDLQSIVVEATFSNEPPYTEDEDSVEPSIDELVWERFGNTMMEAGVFTPTHHQDDDIFIQTLLRQARAVDSALQQDNIYDAESATGMDRDAFFGAFCLLAVSVENENWLVSDYSGDQLVRFHLGLLQPASDVIMARLCGTGKRDIIRLVSRLALAEADRNILVRWASRQLSFVLRR